MEKGWKQIYFTQKEYQAQMARDILKLENMDAVILSHHDSAYTTFGEFEVYVREENEEKALELIKELKR